MKKIRLPLIALCALSACSAPETSLPENAQNTKIEATVLDDVYQSRFAAYSAGNLSGLNLYDPLKAVAGADNYTPFELSESQAISPDAIQAAIDYLQDRRTTSFMIWHEGELVAQKYFDDQTPDGTINSRSLAKPLGVIAVGRAIKSGHIKSLDQPVSDFFHEWKTDDRSKILVRHLLDMRTGLMMQTQEKDPNHVMNKAYLHPAHDQVIIDEYPLINPPGSRYEYANANAELVAPLIERATGQQYEDWMTQEIFKPLGAKGGEVWMNRDGGTAHAGCCTLLPPETFFRLAILYLNEGVWEGDRLLPEGFVDQVKTGTPQYPYAGMGVYVAGDYIEARGPANPDFPLGKTKHGEPYLAEDLFLFDGNGNQVAYIIPSANMVIFRSGTWPSQELGWDNAVLPNIILAGTNFPVGKKPVPQQ